MSSDNESTDEIWLPGTFGESLRSAHEAMAEAGKLYLDQFKGFDRVAKLVAEEQLKQFGAMSSAAKLLAEQASGFRNLDSMKMLTEQVRSFNALPAMTALQALRDQFSNLGPGFSILAEQASAYSKLFDQLRPAIPATLFPALDGRLFDAITPSATLLGALGKDYGVLTNLDGVEDIVGTVSWREQVGEAHVVNAAGILERGSGAGERLDIEVEIKCGLCGGLMPVPRHSVEWQSPAKAKIDVKVLPVCPHCVHEVRGSPEYWIEKLDQMQRPNLKLIRCDGQSSGLTGRDHLRLIEEDPGREE